MLRFQSLYITTTRPWCRYHKRKMQPSQLTKVVRLIRIIWEHQNYPCLKFIPFFAQSVLVFILFLLFCLLNINSIQHFVLVLKRISGRFACMYHPQSTRGVKCNPVKYTPPPFFILFEIFDINQLWLIHIANRGQIEKFVQFSRWLALLTEIMQRILESHKLIHFNL